MISSLKVTICNLNVDSLLPFFFLVMVECYQLGWVCVCVCVCVVKFFKEHNGLDWLTTCKNPHRVGKSWTARECEGLLRLPGKITA
jgi:hypothetical protein